MRKLLLSLSVFLAALGFATPALLQGFASAPDAPATEAQTTEDGDETPEAQDPDALAAAKENATNLVKYLGTIDGLFAEDAVTTATSAIESAEDEEGVTTAKNDFLAVVQATNVSIRSNNIKVEQVPQPDGSTVEKTFTGEYLCNHNELLDDGTLGDSEPHTHGTFGFASVFQFQWVTIGENKGINIISYFDGETPEGIGPNGTTWEDCAWQLEYAEIEGTDGSTIEGIAFKNTSGLYLSSQTKIEGSETPGTELTLQPTSVWTIKRVYLPVSMSFTPASGNVEGGMTITIKPTFVSDGDTDTPVTPGLEGVLWTSSDVDNASVEGTNRFDSMVPDQADNNDDPRNGYLAGAVTGNEYTADGNNEAVITATSVMPAWWAAGSEAISAEYTVTVTPGVENQDNLNAAKTNLQNLVNALYDAGVLTVDHDALIEFTNTIAAAHYQNSDGTVDYDTETNINTRLLPFRKELMGMIDTNAPIVISRDYNDEPLYFNATINDTELPGNGYAAVVWKNANYRSIWTIVPVMNGEDFTGDVYLHCVEIDRDLGPAMAGTQLRSNAAKVKLNWSSLTVGSTVYSGVSFQNIANDKFLCGPENPLPDTPNNTANKTLDGITALNPRCLWTLTKALIPTAVSLSTSVDADSVTVTTVFTPVDAAPFLQRMNYSYTDEGGTSTPVTLSIYGKFATPAAGTYTLTATSAAGVTVTPEGSTTAEPLTGSTEFIVQQTLEAIAADFGETSELSLTEGEDATVTVQITPTPSDYVLDASKLGVVIAAKDATEDTPAVTVKPEIADVDGTLTIHIPAGLAEGEYTLSVTYDYTTLLTADETLAITVTKAPLKSFAAALDKTELTYSAETQNVTVTVTPEPTAYDLSAGTMTAKATESGSEDTDTQADETTEIDLAKGTDSNTWTATIPAETAAGTYTITFSYIEGEASETNKPVTATADLTINPVEYAVVFSGDGIDGTDMTTAPGTATVNVAFQQGGEAVATAPEVTVSLKKGEENATEVSISGGAIALTDLTVGTYTLTITPTNGDNVTLTGAALTIEVTSKTVYNLTLTEGEGDAAAEITGDIEMTAGNSKTITVTFTDSEGATVTPTGWTATIIAAGTEAETDVLSEGKIVIPATLAAGTYTLTLEAPTAEDADYTFTTKTVTVTVNPAPKAVYTPVFPTEPTTVEAGKSVEVPVTFTDAEGTPVTETVAATASVAPATEAVTAVYSEGTLTITANAEAEVKGYTVTLAAASGDADYTIDDKTALTVTVTAAGVEPNPDDPTPGDVISDELPVTAPENDSDNIAAPVVNVTEDEDGNPEVAIDLNASPAGEEGGEAPEAILTVTLPKTEDGNINPAEFESEVTIVKGNESSVVKADITAEGVTINAAGAKIGDIIKIIIRKKQAAGTPEPTPAALLLEEDGEVETGEENPAEEGEIVMTINVTIYGVEFTKAPATATLGINGPVDVTFETNACVPVAKEETPEEGDQEVTTDAAEEETPDVILSVDGEGATVTGNVITFTVAGKYTVTATAGNGKYVATTEITVNEAPTVTGIEAVNADAAAGNATVYDLQGRRINRVNAAGIYIVNGVKTLVR